MRRFFASLFLTIALIAGAGIASAQTGAPTFITNSTSLLTGANFNIDGSGTAGSLAANASGAGVVPLTITGYSGQTADLEDWYNSTPTLLASVSSTGTASFPSLTLSTTPLAIGCGGTGTATAPTQWGIIYASTATGYASTAAGNSGQVLTSNGTSAPTWQTAAGGGGLSHITETYSTSGQYSSGNAGEKLLASGTDANIDVALQPKGTGAIEAQIADGSTNGGNKRGANAVDWQTSRNSNSQVASGQYSTIAGGNGNVASNTNSSVGGGSINIASNTYSTVGGGYANTASGQYSTVGGGLGDTARGQYSAVGGGLGNSAGGTESTIGGGRGNIASGTFSTISGGNYANASLYGQNAQASGAFVVSFITALGSAQTSVYTPFISTSSNTATSLLLDGPSGTNNLTIPSGGAWTFKVMIIGKTSGSPATVGGWEVSGVIYNNGGTATIVGTNVTTTYNTPSTWVVPTVTASGANMIISVTGPSSANVRWVARVETAESIF